MAAMEPILDIPAPEAGDTETVVSSLETAAIFGAKGDAAEALHWLQRAAESASDTGDDARTLTLAHSAATLSRRVHAAPEPENEHAPAPLSPPVVEPAEAEDATPFLLESRPNPPAPSSRPSATGTPPPPPSARAPRPSAVVPDKTTAPSSPAHARPSNLPRPKTSNGTVPNGSSPASRSVTPSLLGAPPAAAAVAPKKPTPDVPSDPAATAVSDRRVRQAARVSVTRSLTERGLYFVRVLDEGQAAPEDAFEGLLVSNDASQSLV
jgi:hypothetical protein